ncbi:MAG: multidrug efflux SMR transporter [Nitrospinota bacterium]|nr:multidrug efflux SMR transporter [Nitrospinota bacterium]
MHWIYLTLAIIAEVTATSALKACEGFTKPVPSLMVIGGYIAAFYLLSLTLQVVPVGTAYAIWSGLGLSLIALVGWLYFGQPMDLAAVVGFGLIVGGVVTLSLFSSAMPH